MSSAQVNVGVVGLGHWGKNVVRSFASTKNCRLVSICDASPTLLQQQQSLYPHAQATENFEHLLQDDRLDAVAIATPAPSHFALAQKALLAGKHVYVEKPMTLHAEQAQELVDLSERKKRKLMVGHLLEYHPAVNFIKRQITEGELGEVYYMYCQRLNLGIVRQSENAFWSLAPHDISVILYLFGMEPSDIVATGQCFLQPNIEDVVFVTLYFPDGKIAQIHVSWLDPHKERKMVLVGSEKMLVFDDTHPTESVRIFNKGACLRGDVASGSASVGVRHGDIFIPHLPAGEPLGLETQHFVDSILHDTIPRSDGRDGLRVVRILEQVDAQLKSVVPLEKRAPSEHRLKIFAA